MASAQGVTGVTCSRPAASHLSPAALARPHKAAVDCTEVTDSERALLWKAIQEGLDKVTTSLAKLVSPDCLAVHLEIATYRSEVLLGELAT